MSKIDELLEEMCPDGVEFKPLWQLTTWNKKFKNVDAEKQPSVIKTKILLANELDQLVSDSGTIKLLTTYPSSLYADDTEEVKDLIREDELIAIPWGGNPYIHYYKGKYITSDNRIAIVNDTSILLTKFLYYYLLANHKHVANLYRGSGIKHPNMPLLIEMEIPLPPIEIQEEIVKILDTFTELEARKKQYAYYRNLLLSFDRAGEERERRFIEIFCKRHGIDFDCDRDLEWKTIGEVANILDNKRKPITKAARVKGEYPYYGANGITDYVSGYIFDGTFLLIGEDGSVITASGNPILNWATGKFWVNNHAHVLQSKDDGPSLRYLMYAISVQNIENVVRGVPPKFNKTNMSLINLPIPPTEVQQLIVDTLDKFSTITENLQNGLPKEIELHRKQYEHYRNRLLTFNKKSDDVVPNNR